jgi:hypothetical protein
MDLVIVAGVGQPVGVLGLTGQLVIIPFVISSASRTGVRSVFSADGPAPDTPGTVDKMVFARIPQKSGLFTGTRGIDERNVMVSTIRFSIDQIEDIA